MSACAAHTHYIPQPGEGITLSDHDRATSRNELVNVTVDPIQLDSYSPNDSDRIIAFRVGIRNVSPNPVPLSPDEFLLLDESGRQYSALPPQMVARGYDCYPRYGSGFGWGWGGGWGRHWGGGFDGYWGDYRCDSRFNDEVLSDSLFPSSPLQPGARVTGVVFFRGNPEETGPLRMELHFPGAATLSFPFLPQKHD